MKKVIVIIGMVFVIICGVKMVKSEKPIIEGIKQESVLPSIGDVAEAYLTYQYGEDFTYDELVMDKSDYNDGKSKLIDVFAYKDGKMVACCSFNMDYYANKLF